MTNDQFQIEHRADATRYVLVSTEGGETAKAGEERYLEMAGDDRPQRVLFHTVVKDEYGGQGLASKLVRHAIEDSIAAGFDVVPVCPYVVQWVEKHPEYAEHVVKARPEHVRAVRDGQP